MDEFWKLLRESLPQVLGTLIAAAIIAFVTTAYAGYGLVAAILAAAGTVVALICVFWIYTRMHKRVGKPPSTLPYAGTQASESPPRSRTMGTEQYNRLLQILQKRFSQEDLIMLVFSILGPGSYCELSGDTHTTKAIGLLEFLKTRGHVEDLVAYIAKTRPDIDLSEFAVKAPTAPPTRDEEKYTKLRIFVASPDDVAEERECLKLVVDELNRTIADHLRLTLDLLDWHTHVAPRMGRPQQVVFDQLPLENWDVFVGILWTRFGTPSGGTHPVTGEPFLSGTEEEFTLAYQAWRETGRPQMLFYRCVRPVPVNVDVSQLQRVQRFFVDFGMTGTHPGLPISYKTVEDFERRIRGDLTQLLFDYGKERLLETRQPDLAEQIAKLQAPEPKPVPPPHVPFINREDELKQILSSFASPYHLVDAPAGYGKTSLLKELRRRFEEQNWISVYVSVQEHRSLPDVAQALAAQLGVSLTLDPDARRLGLNLGRAIVQQHGDDFAQKGVDSRRGVILFIDVDKRPWTSLLPTVDALFVDFIPGVEYSLRSLDFFKESHNPFRVVFAGRYLAGKTPPTSPLPLTILKLTPFNYEVVRDSARVYLSDQRGVGQLAAHLMHYTAGHPGCMARVLELYQERGYPPDEFFRYSAEEIWENIVWPEADAVHNDIRRGLRRIFDDLSILRCLEYGVLRRLLKEAAFPEYKNEFDLADELTGTYLMDWKGRLLRDDITRRLLVIRLLQEIGPQSFAKHCQRAQTICIEHLQDPSAQMPEMWTIEFLFQSLQQHAEDIQDCQKRMEIRQNFLGEVVPQALRLLVDGRKAREEQHAVKRAMEADWEVQFTVNYFLREGEYNDEPYRELSQRIDDFFRSIL